MWHIKGIEYIWNLAFLSIRFLCDTTIASFEIIYSISGNRESKNIED